MICDPLNKFYHVLSQVKPKCAYPKTEKELVLPRKIVMVQQ